MLPLLVRTAQATRRRLGFLVAPQEFRYFECIVAAQLVEHLPAESLFISAIKTLLGATTKGA